MWDCGRRLLFWPLYKESDSNRGNESKLKKRLIRANKVIKDKAGEPVLFSLLEIKQTDGIPRYFRRLHYKLGVLSGEPIRESERGVVIPTRGNSMNGMWYDLLPSHHSDILTISQDFSIPYGFFNDIVFDLRREEFEKDFRSSIYSFYGQNRVARLVVGKDKIAGFDLDFHFTEGIMPPQEFYDGARKYITQLPQIDWKSEWRKLGNTRHEVEKAQELELTR